MPAPAHRMRDCGKSRGFVVTAFACALIVGAVLRAAEQQTAASIEAAYRTYRFDRQPKLNPKTAFAIEELHVPDLWSALGIQLFTARAMIDGEVFADEPFLWANGKIHGFENSFGGMGVLSGVVAGGAFYYSYSWGSGIHRSLVGRLTIENGQLVQRESDPLYFADMFVERTADGRVRVVTATWRGFNAWADAVPLGWIDLQDRTGLTLRDDVGRELRVPTSPPEVGRASDAVRPPLRKRTQRP